MPWEETEKYVRSGHRAPEEFQQDTFKTIMLNEQQGIQAIVGKPNGKNTLEIQSYLFSKDKGWNLEKANALLGLYDYEGYSSTVQKTYQAINAIAASPQYPAYNSAVCWAGYINVKAKTLACDYYDAVTSGILAKIRQHHDKPAYEFSAKTISMHLDEFMFWGTNHANYAPVENKQAMATVCWLGQLLLGFEPPLTRFTQVLNSKGENLTLYPITETGETTAYGEAVDLKAIVLPGKAEEIFLEPGYIINDYLVLHVLAPIRRHDKITRSGIEYEVTSIQDFTFKDEIAFRKVTLRRLQS
jgi:hypothetical protein